MTDSLKIREKLALILMSGGDDAKRLILFLVYQTIARNKGITINQLTHFLYKTYSIDRESIASSVSALSSSELFNCLTTWTEAKTKVVHLQSKETNTIKEWLADFYAKVPELNAYEAPQYQTLSGKKLDNDVTVVNA